MSKHISQHEYTPRLPQGIARQLAPRARLISVVGAVVTAISCFLAWSYVSSVLGDLTIYGYPGPLQMFVLVIAILCLGLLAVTSPLLNNVGATFDEGAGVRAAGYTIVFGTMGVIVAIAAETGAVANIEFGVVVALLGGLTVLLGGMAYPTGVDPQTEGATHPELPGWASAIVLAVCVALGMLVTVYVLGEDDAASFLLAIGAIIGIVFVLVRSRVGEWFSMLAGQQRSVLLIATFVAAVSLPLTQDGSDAIMSIAVQVLIFAATAVGLNIVVGLAGLLDLGYIAFLGAGAYVAAMMSESIFATINVDLPFIVIVVIGMAVSATLGLIIGSPTLRVSGDYLAIVTLAFGEIFRFAMLNLDGSTGGPNLTGGPNGIPAIPDLVLFGFDFGTTHEILGVPITRFSNYYFLMLLVMAVIVLVFSRLNASRIGRGWVAIREDEKAAEAMGVNVFGLKLLAFAGGAALAGMAGTVKAHVDVSVTPDQYIFLESAFLLAAVVLGGMGTVTGVIVGAVLLKLLPEKLRFFSEYRLLMFGLLLVVMMRFRPEGLVEVNRRHPAEDYPEAVQDGHNRPIDGAILKGVSS